MKKIVRQMTRLEIVEIVQLRNRIQSARPPEVPADAWLDQWFAHHKKRDRLDAVNEILQHLVNHHRNLSEVRKALWWKNGSSIVHMEIDFFSFNRRVT